MLKSLLIENTWAHAQMLRLQGALISVSLRQPKISCWRNWNDLNPKRRFGQFCISLAQPSISFALSVSLIHLKNYSYHFLTEIPHCTFSSQNVCTALQIKNDQTFVMPEHFHTHTYPAFILKLHSTSKVKDRTTSDLDSVFSSSWPMSMMEVLWPRFNFWSLNSPPLDTGMLSRFAISKLTEDRSSSIYMTSISLEANLGNLPPSLIKQEFIYLVNKIAQKAHPLHWQCCIVQF